MIENNEDNLIENNDDIKSVEDIVNKINEDDSDETKKPKTKRKYNKKKKEIKIVPSEKVINQFEEVQEIGLDEDDLKSQLVEDLNVLEYKFKDHIDLKLSYSYPETSVKELKRQKSLYLRLVNESASMGAVFESMLFVSRGAEKISQSLNIVDIGGLTEDLNDNREEIMNIVKELVDAGQISVAELTPEIKLCMLMTNITIRRLEKNRSKNSVNIMVDVVDGEDNGVGVGTIP